MSEINQEQIQQLRGWRTAIEQEGSAVEEIFGTPPKVEPAAGVEPEKAPPPRKAPTEVKASEPSGDSKETDKAKAKLLTEWRAARKDLSPEVVEEVRKSAGVDLINTGCTVEQLEAVVRKASEIAEGKRE